MFHRLQGLGPSGLGVKVFRVFGIFFDFWVFFRVFRVFGAFRFLGFRVLFVLSLKPLNLRGETRKSYHSLRK